MSANKMRHGPKLDSSGLVRPTKAKSSMGPDGSLSRSRALVALITYKIHTRSIHIVKSTSP